MFAKGQLILDKSPADRGGSRGAVREEAGQGLRLHDRGRQARAPPGHASACARKAWSRSGSGLERGVPVVRARIGDLKPGAPAILKTSAVATKPVGSG
jgi:hypothetical protein